MKISKNTLNGLVDGFGNMTVILPAVIAMSVCSAFAAPAMLVTAIICCVLKPFTGAKPSFAAFIVVYSTAAIYGTGAALAGTFLSGIILLILSAFDFEKATKAIYAPVVAAIMMGYTLYMTIMQTTDYFGIGATGRTFVEMIKSYKSLGFHSNWRGMLYGTIALVLMIVYRRKMKNLSKIIPAAFWCIVFTIILNLLLIPNADNTPIGEIGDYSLKPVFILDKFTPNVDSVIGALVCCGALTLIEIFCICTADKHSKVKSASIGAGLVVSSLSGGLPLIKGNDEEKSISQKIISALIGCVLCALIIMPMHTLIERIPIPTAAVILILSMWQQNDGKYFTATFKSGFTGVIVFFAVIAVTLLVTPQAAVIIGGFICAGYKLTKKEKSV